MQHKDKIFTTHNGRVEIGDDTYTVTAVNGGQHGQLLPMSKDGFVSSHTWETGDWLHGNAFSDEMQAVLTRDKTWVYIGKFAATGGTDVTLEFRPEIIKFAAGRRISLYDPLYFPLLIELAKKDAQKN